jgi:hypothetical protein
VDEELIERIAAAIDGVQLFSRFNDWTSDHVPGLPIEICYWPKDGNDEVVVERFSADVGEQEALRKCVRHERAVAALKAIAKFK